MFLETIECKGAGSSRKKLIIKLQLDFVFFSTHPLTLFYFFAILICRPCYPFSAAKKSIMKKTNHKKFKKKLFPVGGVGFIGKDSGSISSVLFLVFVDVVDR